MGPILEEPGDQFPIGMRVLAVDDDPICLRILQFLLTTCHYQVRTTNRATTALNMLRENKFDMVISDVHMPDMDGLKFLELMGLEMDLPVIMLSANSDPELVMKGIDHGACDYMLKPIRIEELKIIWQHVIRKRKQAPKDQNNSGNQKRHENGGGEGQLFGNFDTGESSYRKRKDQNDNEVDENKNDNGVDNEDPSAQKKPRVVWTVDLHRDFVLAVNQLGIDKAVPKKILELMGVDYLTREHVASHLQKYRIYLRRLNNDVNQQPNMDPMGNTDPNNYAQVDPMNGFQNYYAMPGSGQFQNTMFNSFPPRGMIGQSNTPIGLGMHGLGVGRMGHAQTTSSPGNGLGMFQPGVFPRNHNGSILQGMPMSMELEALYNNNNSIGGLSNAIHDMTLFPVHSSGPHSNSFPGSNYFQQAALHTSSLSNRPTTMTLPIGSNLSGAFSTPTQLQYRRTDLQGQTASNSNNVGQNIGNAPYLPNYSSVAHVNGAPGSSGQSLDHQNINFSGNMDFNSIRQPSFVQHSELDRSGVETAMQLHEGYLMDQQRQQGSFVANSFGSLEDLATAMMTQDEDNVKPNAYFESGSYPPQLGL